MKVHEAITELLKYNQQAELNVVAHHKAYDFTFSYGSSEGCTKQTADSVSLYVDELCQNEIIAPQNPQGL